MKRWTWFVLAAVGIALVGGVAFGAKRALSPNNPFQNRYMDVLELVTTLRLVFQPRLIEISSKNPLDLRYIQYLWVLGYPSNALAQFWEVCQKQPPTTLGEFLEIPYMGGSSRIPRLLLLFKFPDEATVLSNVRIEKPDWWDLIVNR